MTGDERSIARFPALCADRRRRARSNRRPRELYLSTMKKTFSTRWLPAAGAVVAAVVMHVAVAVPPPLKARIDAASQSAVITNGFVRMEIG